MGIDWPATIMGIVVVIVFNYIWRAFRKKIGRPALSRSGDRERARKLYGIAEQKLIRAGFSDLMVRDFNFRTVLSPEACRNPADLQKQMQSMLSEMLPHLHLIPDIRLVVTADRSLFPENAAGCYASGGSGKEIRVLFSSDPAQRKPAVLTGVLCHECAHFFMYSYAMNLPDPKENEGLTDTMACLLGFRRYMLQSRTDMNAPYLNHEELREVQKCLLAARPGLQKEIDGKKNLETAASQLKKNLASARVMMEQTRAMIAANGAPSSRRLSPRELKSVQQALLELENGTSEEILRRSAGAVGQDLAGVRKADDAVLAVCDGLYRLMTAFRL